MKRNLLVLLCIVSLQTYAENVKIGFAVRDITPKPEDFKDGIRVWGWSAAGPARELQEGDNLSVRALAIRDRNDTILVILTADTLKFHIGDTYMLQEWFEQTFGINRWHLVVNASHTHQAPGSCIFSSDPYARINHPRFFNAVKAAIAEAVENATTPTVVKFANLQINEDMVFNKNQRLADRDPRFGKIDADMPVFAFFDAETDKITGFLWSVAAHPTYLAGGGLHSRNENGPPVSSHAPGAVARALKKTYGENVTALFTQGAAGDTKMQFPELEGNIRRTRFRDEETESSGSVFGYVWQSGEREGELMTQEEYVRALDNYAKLYVDIIKQGFENENFRTVEDIELKIAGKEMKVPIALERPQPKTPLGQRNRTYWTRPKDSAEYYKKIIDDKDAPERERNSAYLELSKIHDDEHAAYMLFISTVVMNDKLRIVTMSNEVCYEIGEIVKEYYRASGIKTAFFGYSPFGTPYYPSNLQKEVGTYQGAWMHPPEDFDFDKFALDSITGLIPE